MARKPPNAGKGRKKGVPNKITGQVRQIIADLADHNAAEAQAKLDAIEEPGEWLRVYQGFLEYAMPKLARVEKGIADASDEELLQEVRRRKAEAAAKPPSP